MSVVEKLVKDAFDNRGVTWEQPFRLDYFGCVESIRRLCSSCGCVERIATPYYSSVGA